MFPTLAKFIIPNPVFKMSANLKQNIITYIKWSMLELACNNNGGYDGRKKSKSKLYEAIENNGYDFNLGIELVADQLILNQNGELQKIISKIQKINASEDIDEEDGDDRYELEQEMFDYVNGFIELDGISSLDCDDSDKFKEKMDELLIGVVSSDDEDEK
jgi:hypothetical protein